MTGYGTSRYEKSGVKITVELRTLNSKFIDVLIKLPKEFSDQELKVRSLLGDKLHRGKVNLTVDYSNESTENANQIDQKILIGYYQQLKALSEKTGESETNCFELAARMPDVIATGENSPTEEEWLQVELTITEAIEACDSYRISEGEKLMPVLLSNSEIIAEKLNLVKQADPERIETIKNRISGSLKEHLSGDAMDKNRFEQEAVYFLEKLDITEEKVRLKSHLNYFQEVLKADFPQGKKLGFITQEIGREINTIGSKANNASIQHLVVEMKEELEKIREQLLNIL